MKRVVQDLPIVAPLHRVFLGPNHRDETKKPHEWPKYYHKKPRGKFYPSFGKSSNFEPIMKQQIVELVEM